MADAPPAPVPVPLPDLPAPRRLWGEGAARAVLHALLPELGTGCERYRGGLRTTGRGSRAWVTAWVEGGRAVLLGVHGSHSDAAAGVGEGARSRFRDPVVDLLAGGPGWLPWEWLHEAMRDLEAVRSVAWWDGSAWFRAPVPEGLDGAIRLAVEDPDDAARERADPASEDQAVAARVALRAAGVERRIDRSALEALVAALKEPGSADVPAALEQARALGVAPGTEPPAVEAGRGEPAGRRVPLPDAQIGGSLSLAMLAVRESERPTPVGGPALEAVLAWMEERGLRGIRVVHRSTRHRRFDVLAGTPAARVDPVPDGLLDAWREEEGRPGSGRWLCARIRREGGRTVVERAYDGLPAWQGLVGWDATGAARLREEMASRHPVWRPVWAPVLGEDFARDGAPAHLCWRPGLTADPTPF